MTVMHFDTVAMRLIQNASEWSLELSSTKVE